MVHLLIEQNSASGEIEPFRKLLMVNVISTIFGFAASMGIHFTKHINRDCYKF